ncbi:MAG: CPBP family intramembrane metalloprotease [Verrucomicrobium sp.]|jgi:membrane protease YdiL (CAAX protease family)|nr:CPBP family intramembrane metalloprotease [Verrucomicrobium sp.]
MSHPSQDLKAGADRPPADPLPMLAVYLMVVFLGGALLAPWVWKVVQEAAPGSSLAGQPFRRYVDRSLLALALAALWPMMRLGWFPGIQSAGLAWRPRSRGDLWIGLTGGMLSMAVVAGTAIGFGARTWNPNHPLPLYFLHVARALGAAVAVSLIEEFLFRGMILGSLRRCRSFAVSAAISSSLFAIVHFFRRPESPASVDPWTGLEVLGRMLAGLSDPASLLPGLLSLGLIGWLLSWCRERTGSLWLPIGLHAGWIFWFKSYQFLTVPAAGSEAQAWWWGSTRLHDGWLTLVVLALTSLLIVRSVGRRVVAAEPLRFPG